MGRIGGDRSTYPSYRSYRSYRELPVRFSFCRSSCRQKEKPMNDHKARMTNVVMSVPGFMDAMTALHACAEKSGLSHQVLELVALRASQINGCSVCVDMHTRRLRKAGEPEERVFTVAAWRDAPYFNDAERAALALTEAATRISDLAHDRRCRSARCLSVLLGGRERVSLARRPQRARVRTLPCGDDAGARPCRGGVLRAQARCRATSSLIVFRHDVQRHVSQ